MISKQLLKVSSMPETDDQSITVTLNKRERDLVLAALRLWQCGGRFYPQIIDIAMTNRADLPTATEIDNLCEAINV